MKAESANDRLSQMSTAWTVLFQAHGGTTDAAKAARRELLQSYRRPVFRYLAGAVRNQEVAEDLYQEFALRFVRGDFRRAHPDRGRFRDFLKTSLYRMVVDHQRSTKKRPIAMADGLPDPAAPTDEGDQADREFVGVWRAHLLERSWMALEADDEREGLHNHLVLRASVDAGGLSSEQLAALVGERIGKPLSPEAYRKRLHVARKKFALLLYGEVASTLENPTPDAIDDELAALGLLEYCKELLARARHP